MVCARFEKVWRVYLSEESHGSPVLLKVPIYSTELVAVIFVWKVRSTVLNAPKHLQWSHSYGQCVSLTISQQQLQINFLEEQLKKFAFIRVTFGTATFSKELLFRSTYSLIFFRDTVVFGNSHCLEDLFEALNFCKDNRFFSKHHLQPYIL